MPLVRLGAVQNRRGIGALFDIGQTLERVGYRKHHMVKVQPVTKDQDQRYIVVGGHVFRIGSVVWHNTVSTALQTMSVGFTV